MLMANAGGAWDNTNNTFLVELQQGHSAERPRRWSAPSTFSVDFHFSVRYCALHSDHPPGKEIVPVPEEEKLHSSEIENIKKALVSAGFLKSTTLDKHDEARLREELNKHGIDALRLPFGIRIICHSNHYCLVVPSLI
jgi:hypothetical protein